MLLAEPVFGTAIPPILYVYINRAVIIGAGAAKLLALVMAMPAVDEWIGEKVATLAPIGRVATGQARGARISEKRRATRVDEWSRQRTLTQKRPPVGGVLKQKGHPRVAFLVFLS
ncbi:hypothetical protein [Cryobacterium sp. Y62]|uniref:hypothetical protein n=1 Tax=Cryobacterium sp. Y62 TaxID=2048284 RepID=UPI000CE2ECDC|nr:hypothetical protein [Cryobacterium sp. Y62]